MNYKNGKEILPYSLLEQLQEYIQGEIIYIPKKEKARAPWGTMNGTRELMMQRNEEIFCKYNDGVGIETLIQKYCLSEDSIKKIITKERKEEKNEF